MGQCGQTIAPARPGDHDWYLEFFANAGAIPQVLQAWEEAIPSLEEYSPLAACWYTEFGGLNRFTHVWVYKDLNERARIRDESRQATHWPPRTSVRPVRQENKILIPAGFSAVK